MIEKTKIIWEKESLLGFDSFADILKYTGIQDNKFKEMLNVTNPTWIKKKKNPERFRLEELELISKLISNQLWEFPLKDLVEFIRIKNQ
jgi:hypothetical protein